MIEFDAWFLATAAVAVEEVCHKMDCEEWLDGVVVGLSLAIAAKYCDATPDKAALASTLQRKYDEYVRSGGAGD